MIATCTVCGGATSLEWERCGWCGSQRLLHHDGTPAGHRRYGGFWRRMLASAIDTAPLVALLTLVFAAPQRYVIAGEPGEYRDAFLAETVLVIIIAWFLYPCIALGARGRTVGKRLLDLHVVDRDGSPVSYPRAAMREGVGRVLEVLLIVPVGVASAASLAFDERARALHDRIATTTCVRGAPVPRPAAAPEPVAPPPPAPVPVDG